MILPARQKAIRARGVGGSGVEVRVGRGAISGERREKREEFELQRKRRPSGRPNWAARAARSINYICLSWNVQTSWRSSSMCLCRLLGTSSSMPKIGRRSSSRCLAIWSSDLASRALVWFVVRSTTAIDRLSTRSPSRPIPVGLSVLRAQPIAISYLRVLRSII